MEAETINRQLTRARDVFLGVLEVLEERVLTPRNTFIHISLRVGEALDGSGLSTEETVKVGAD